LRASDSEVEATLQGLDAISVFVAGDDALARGGLAMVLASQVRTTVVGQGLRSADWDAAARAAQAHAVVLDGGQLDVSTCERIRAAGLPVVVLVDSAQDARDALASGARGALSREDATGHLGPALRAAVRGLLVVDAAFGKVLVARREVTQAPDSLTEREREVLDLLARGLANKSIAQELSISEHTAKFHVNAILSKLGAESRTDAVVRAARLGLVVL